MNIRTTEKLERVADQLRGLSTRGKSLLKLPPVHFGAPRQRAPEPAVSWWYVPIFIEPGTVHQRLLDRCAVYLVPLAAGPPLRLRWRGSGSAMTVDEITLLAEQLYLVPVAARKERAGGSRAIITTAQFLAQGKAKWTIPAGQSLWRLQVHSSSRQWDSPHLYALNVPPAEASNGHFTFEILYDRLEQA